MNCEFETISENTHRCKRCGFTLKMKVFPSQLKKVCKTDEPLTVSAPNVVQKARNLAREGKEWVEAGGAVVSEEERQRRLSICQGCEHFVNGSCRLCGCIMSLKTRMETAHCPLNPPKW